MASDLRPGFVRFSIDQCPHGTKSFSINGSSGSGSRLLGPKCCGRTTEVHTWGCTPEVARRIVEEIESYAEEAERERA